LRVLVAFDGFQEVLTAQDNIDAVIRSVIQRHADTASYVFAGSHIGMLDGLLGDPRRAFYAQARPLGLGPLPLDAVADRLADAFATTGKDVGRALGPTLDHPQRTGAGGAADEETFVVAARSAILEVGDELRPTLAALGVAERRVLTRMVLTRIAADDDTLYRGAASAGPRGSVRYAVGNLIRRGLVTADATRLTRHGVVDPLLARWVNDGRRG
jgi:hypothetical protein